MDVSVEKYAKMRGISEEEVRNAIKSGRISCNKDGTIDREQADMDWFLNADQEKENGWRLILGSQWAERDEEDKRFIEQAHWGAYTAPADKEPWMTWVEDISVQIADELGINKDALEFKLKHHMAVRLHRLAMQVNKNNL